MPDHDDTDALIRLIGGWRTRRAVVAGDFMLDHHVFGSAARLSPDAPVPVLAAQREQFVPGGAANVALDLAALRCRVDCLGVVGRDPEARTLKTALRDAKCGVTGLVPSSDRPTSVKHSFIGLAQQKTPQKMFRVDDERAAPVPDEVRRRLVSAAEKLIPAADVLCLQDHDKGVLTDRICQQLIRIARRHRVPVLVDPAAIESFDRYRGATCITPNRFEAAQAVGRGQSLQDDRALRSVAARMLEKLNLTAVVLTLDRSGALLQERKRRPVLLPTAVREVYDVTGAGDMVLSMLAAAVANGAGWPDALRLAN
ncbi:MAG: bifunctional heptose 7-phosphate kinase/heptose 1-phosphate adenyltransferase, partial [Phycisphaeraceae bacterium]|nr:bifunctional heptose 7-phosphate kinase/heptose 1-phosphate adenyltransferase [Phycisphaeraceae bacterium]